MIEIFLQSSILGLFLKLAPQAGIEAFLENINIATQ